MVKTRTVLPMTEDDLLGSVLDMAKHLRLRTAHFRPALTTKGWVTPVSGDGKGFLDVVICGTRLLVRELKSETGVTSPDQKLWIAAFDRAGVDVGIWKPEDLRSGRIEAEMKGIA